MTDQMTLPDVDLEGLRCAIQAEYAEVAAHPDKGFHFHTGRPLAHILGYADEWLAHVPAESLASFAGTGNPFSVGTLQSGEHVVDVGSGAGIDSFVAAHMVGPRGRVIGVDMTPEMLAKARCAATDAGVDTVEFREGYMEALPVASGWADVVISNGVINLSPDKPTVFGELHRVLKPGGRLQIGDILVQKAVPESAKSDIALWTG